MTVPRTILHNIKYFILIAVIMSLLTIASPLAAQDMVNPPFRISRVDTSNFPDISLYVTGRNTSLQNALELTLLEDGVEQKVQGSELKRASTQTALVLDASSSIVTQGETGDPRHVEVAHVVRRLVEQQLLLPDADWLTSIVPVAGGESRVLLAWTRDHNAVSNLFYQFEPDRDIGSTSLYKLLSDALDSFESSGDVQPDASKSIVAFSDGVAEESQASLDAIVQQAERMEVRIHTVLVGPDQDIARESMQQIARLTGGQYFHLTSVGALDELWQALVDNASQQVLTYRSQKASPRQVTIQVRLENGTSFELSEPIPPITPPVAPADLQLQIVSPPAGDVIERSSDDPEAASSELQPKELVLEVQVSWPDGHPRTLNSIEVNLDGQSQTLDVSSLEGNPSFPLSIVNLAEGNHVLSVSAVDELGLAGESSLPFRIVENRPPLPTATSPPSPTATPVPAPAPTLEGGITTFVRERGLEVAALAFGLLALILLLALSVVVLVLIKPSVRKRVSELLTGALGAVTEPFRRDSDAQKSPKARLVRISAGNPDLPAVIPLYSSNALIGREPSLVNVVLRDRRVSRYHCRINQEADGSFRIWDEGSLTGTYVNNEQVGMSGQPLRPDDIINIGPVQYRFEPLRQVQPSADMEALDGSETLPYLLSAEKSSADSTEIYMPSDAEPDQPEAGQSLDRTEIYVPDGTETIHSEADESIDSPAAFVADGTETIHPEEGQPTEPDDWAEIEEDTHP